MSLPSGGKARIEIDDFVFQVAAVPAGKPLVHGRFANSDCNTLLYVGLSLLGAHRPDRRDGVLRSADGLDGRRRLDRDQQYLMQQYLERGRRARARAERDRAGRRDQRRQQRGRHRDARQGRRRLDG